jgi:hypothetical protein
MRYLRLSFKLQLYDGWVDSGERGSVHELRDWVEAFRKFASRNALVTAMKGRAAVFVL